MTREMRSVPRALTAMSDLATLVYTTVTGRRAVERFQQPDRTYTSLYGIIVEVGNSRESEIEDRAGGMDLFK